MTVRREKSRPAATGTAPKQNTQILTAWSYEPTDCGKLHRVARYVLVKRGAV